MTGHILASGRHCCRPDISVEGGSRRWGQSTKLRVYTEQKPRTAFQGQSLPLAAEDVSRRHPRCRVLDCRAVSNNGAGSSNGASSSNGSEHMTVAITGATGLVGSRLVARLLAQGQTVRVLTRNVARARKVLSHPALQYYEPAQWKAAIRGCTAVVNLAGEAIAPRWTPATKAEIKRSRVLTTTSLVEAINSLPERDRPQVFVSTSAIGYYGTSTTQTFSEASGSGSDYLAEVCRKWEAAAGRAQVARMVVFRTGLVLAKEGGTVGKMLPLYSAGVVLGNGKQWCSWIHRDDLVELFLTAMRDSRYSGVYNATAPHPVRMAELCDAMGQALGRPAWLPIPEYALQTLLGEGATLVLEGQRVVPTRTQELGFAFKFPRVNQAMQQLLR